VYVRFSKHYGFKPPILKEIVFLRSKGFSNLEISEEIGVSRNTVSNYLEKLRGIEDNQMAELMSLVGMMMERHNRIADLMFRDSFLGEQKAAGAPPHKGKNRAFYKEV